MGGQGAGGSGHTTPCYNPSVNIQSLHPWDVDPRAAADLQRDLAARVIVRDEVAREPRFVAGVDLSPPDANGEATAAAVLSWSCRH